MSVLCDLLVDVQGKLAQLWLGSTAEKVDGTPEYEALRAVLDKQTVSMPQLLEIDGKKRKVKIEWLTDCDQEAEECDDSCTLTGRELSTNCKEYELGCIAQKSFKIPLVNSDSYHSYVDKFAKGMQQNHKGILEELAEYVILGLVSNSGVNQHTGAPGQVVGTTTYINPVSWNDSIWGYMALARRRNKMGEEFYIDDINLWNLVYNRTLEAGNADGKGNFAKLPQNKIYSDVVNMALSAPNTTFMIDRNAVAMVSLSPADVIYPLKNPTGTNPYELEANKVTYTEMNMFDQRIKMEVTIQRVCEGDGVYYDIVRHKAWGIFAVNPTPCNGDQTGILQFVCGTHS